jgi:hypothetical protein
MPSTLLRVILLLAPFALVAWWSPAPTTANTPPGAPLGLRLAARAAAPEAEQLRSAAQDAADRAFLAEDVDVAHAAERAQAASLAALADLPDADALPWDAWIDAELQNRDALALGLFAASVRADAPDGLARAKRLGTRNIAVPLRMEAHRVMWRLDPQLAQQQGRGLVRELPRGTTGMHARFVNVLAEVDLDESQELLILIAHREGLESHARIAAIEALMETGRPELGADLATIWSASTGDIATRQQALLATLELDPILGEQILLSRLPNPDTQPVLYGFAMDLIAERGLSLDS